MQFHSARSLVVSFVAIALASGCCSRSASKGSQEGPRGEGVDVAFDDPRRWLAFETLGPDVVKIDDPFVTGEGDTGYLISGRRFAGINELLAHLAAQNDAYFDQGILLVYHDKGDRPAASDEFLRLASFAVERNIDFLAFYPRNFTPTTGDPVLDVEWAVRSTHSWYDRDGE